MKFVIEHFEPQLFEWSFIEYQHVFNIVGKKNLVFSNINKKDQNRLKKYGAVYENGICDLNFDNVCVLSQYSRKTLTAKDKNKFKYFVFGGILGDNPAKKRTNTIIKNLKSKKIKIKFETRNLGNKQMPTDVAVYVTKKILDGKKLSDFKFVDELEIEINENESVILPFRYVVDDNKLIINEKIIEYLRKRKEL